MDTTRSADDEDKLRCTEALRAHLQTATSLRRRANDDPRLARQRMALRTWQAARLSRTHHDLLHSPRYAKAAHFFLTELYGPKDFSARDEEIEHIMPLLISLLPLSALQTLSLAIEVDALSEEFDAAMVSELERAGATEHIDAEHYAEAYRRVGWRLERERQIDLIRATGDALRKLAAKPLLATLLSVMRGPAHLAGLGDLHEFLSNGFDAFRSMQADAEDFLDTIEARERALLERLFDGRAEPFAVQACRPPLKRRRSG